MQKQACPLCFSEAVFEFTSNPYGKLFSCTKCTEFFIDSSSEKYIEELPEVTKTECREKLSNLAKKQKVNSKFIIREPRNEERGGNGHDVAQTQMIAEWVEHGFHI
jgi:Zn-finger protein